MTLRQRIHILIQMNQAFIDACCELVPDDGRTLWNSAAAAYFMGKEL